MIKWVVDFGLWNAYCLPTLAEGHH